MTLADTVQDPLQHIAPNGHTPVPGAKRRILDTANRLFYEEGIRSVGIDRLIGESTVTKATFYKHYGSKDRLISEYLDLRSRREADSMTELMGRPDDRATVFRALVAAIVEDVERPGFRGCPFLNAAVEFSDPNHPVRAAVLAHRDWYTGALVELLRELGHRMPGHAADDFMLARDGAMAGGYAGDSIAAATALVRAMDRVLAEATP